MWEFANNHPVAAFFCIGAIGMTSVYVAEQIHLTVKVIRGDDE